MEANTQIVKWKKQRLGFVYGATSGIAYAVFAWGIDAFLLAMSNAAYYWIKFLPGLLISFLICSFAGWLTTTTEKHSVAIIAWGIVGILLSLLSVWLSFTASQVLIERINPALAQYMGFEKINNLIQFRLVGMAIIELAAIMCGLLEINLVQQAIHSNNGLSTISALLVCIFIFAVAGSAIDQEFNSNLREPIQSINELIVFGKENYGKDVPKLTARKMHLSALNRIQDLIQKDHRLVLVGYDENLGLIDILVDFEGTLVKCTTIYSQPTDCILVP